MRIAIQWIMILGMAVLSTGAAHGAEEATPAAGAPTTTQESKEAAMQAAMERSKPGEPHKALEPLVGNWQFTATMWMEPDAPPQSMSGTSTNSLIFDGRFLKQETRGTMEGFPPFQSLGFTGYDNIRQEYQTVWLDSMNTSMMSSKGAYDPAAKQLTQQGEFSCPMTGEPHRKFRDVWALDDPEHPVLQSFSRTPDGREYKAMEIRYSKVQS